MELVVSQAFSHRIHVMTGSLLSLSPIGCVCIASVRDAVSDAEANKRMMFWLDAIIAPRLDFRWGGFGQVIAAMGLHGMLLDHMQMRLQVHHKPSSVGCSSCVVSCFAVTLPAPSPLMSSISRVTQSDLTLK